MARPKLLDLFCCAGGSSMGYYEAGFDVVGVDIKRHNSYPFPFILANALTVPLDGFDVYHASPPCQKYCDNNIQRETSHPDLIDPVRERLEATGKPFIIENVEKAPLNAQLMLCGTMFGLRVIRHRYFEFSFAGPLSPYTCNHWGTTINADFAPVYGHGSRGRRSIEILEDGKIIKKRDGRGKPPPNGWTYRKWFSESMAINWMTSVKELTEAIPPAYTKFIGKYIIDHVL